MYKNLSRFCALLLATTLLGCSSTGGLLSYESDPPKVPFDLPNVAGEEINLLAQAGGGYEVPVILNGKIKVNLQLDSGADVTQLPAATAWYLTLLAKRTSAPMKELPEETFLTASGKSFQARRFVLHSLQIGSRVFRNVEASAPKVKDTLSNFISEEELKKLEEAGRLEAVVAELLSFEQHPEFLKGLLGQTILSRLGRYTIDNKRRMLVLTPSALHVPSYAMYPATSQKSLQAVHHWDVLAEQEASRIVEELGASKAAFFLEPAGAGAFAKGFHDLLTSHLVAKGRTVLTDQRSAKLNDAYRVKYKVQIVSHSEAAGTEVLVTTQVTHAQRVLLSSSKVYYLQDQHKKNYKNPKPATPMKVVNG